MRRDLPTSRKVVPVVFFKETSGNEPVRKWLLSLKKSDRKIIGDDIKTVQYGWPLGMPLVKSLKHGLWEVRCNLPDGIARVLFMMNKGEIVLLHGFMKKTNKTPLQELDVAFERSKRY